MILCKLYKKERHNFINLSVFFFKVRNKKQNQMQKYTFWQIVSDQIDHKIRKKNCLFEYFRGGDVRNKTNKNHFDKELLL